MKGWTVEEVLRASARRGPPGPESGRPESNGGGRGKRCSCPLLTCAGLQGQGPAAPVQVPSSESSASNSRATHCGACGDLEGRPQHFEAAAPMEPFADCERAPVSPGPQGMRVHCALSRPSIIIF
mmetsp:Transcript_70641/g.118039  ORF Transcript_70641/g.118039 Transcript_70641/m.118039 type:complete len:125 (+) Transcript_70641:1064-1438(+)